MPLNLGDTLFERYRIEAVLNRGGMGVIYRAWDERLDVAVAIKEMVLQAQLPPEHLDLLREQFRREARTLARLNHSHLARVIDFFSHDGAEYLVMGYVQGSNLAERIRRQGPLPEDQVRTWAGQLLDALAYCHRNGVYHRDVKPQNVIVDPDGRAVLVDFGLVKECPTSDLQTRTAIRGMGTPQYAPPEQAGFSDTHTDERSDLYSLGATLYHALTGVVPPEVSQRMAHPELLRPIEELAPGVSARTAHAVTKAFEVPVRDRWQSAHEMTRALGVTGSQGLPPAPSEPSPPPLESTVALSPPRPAARRAWIPWAAGALALALVVAGGLWARGRGWFGGSATPTPAQVASVHTATPSPSPTWTATALPTPSPTQTATRTTTPTETATRQPTPSPTQTATATRVPTDTSTRVPTDTPTPTRRWLSAPRLIAPASGSSYAGWNAQVVLQWSSVAGIGPNEYYVVHIPYDDLGGVAEYWRKDTSFQLPSHFSLAAVGFPDRHYNWSVQIMRCASECSKVDSIDPDPWRLGVRGVAVGSKSEDWTFYWHPDTGGGGKKPYGYSAGFSLPPALSGEQPVSAASPYARAFSIAVVAILVFLLPTGKHKAVTRVRTLAVQFFARMVQ
jgi:serine/threonine protein kinase